MIYENPTPAEVITQGKKANHVTVWVRLPKSEEVIRRKGKLGYNEARMMCFITTSVSCHKVNQKDVVKMEAPRIISVRRRRG